VREAREEANLDVKLTGLINIYTYPGVVPIVLVYAAAVTSGELRPEDESLEAAWFERADIPWNELAFRSTRDALEDYHLGLLHPDLI
jgi:ADP-ribose pyrophosphatase YjhB (NUDIX family)